MLQKSNQPKLTVELIPTTCHYSNVRTTVKAKDWDKIRFLSYASAEHKCEICNEKGKQQGFKHDLECHEIWEYDDEQHIQKLIGIISLCPKCHLVKHIGRAIAMGRERICELQLCKVNEWTRQDIDKHLSEAYTLHLERSQHEWILDLSLLTKEPYNLTINENKARVFKIKKYKRKRRSKTKCKKKISKRHSRY